MASLNIRTQAITYIISTQISITRTRFFPETFLSHSRTSMIKNPYYRTAAKNSSDTQLVARQHLLKTSFLPLVFNTLHKHRSTKRMI